MQQVPEEVTALRYLYLGMDHAPAHSEEAVRLLLLKGFWQHAFPRRDDEPPDYLVTPEESLRSAEQAVNDAVAMGRPDLESAALDAVTAYYIPRGLYSAAWPATRRRLGLIGDLHDLWEIGDSYAMQGWLGYNTGAYREAFERCDEGFGRTVAEAPSLALHCLKWRSLARFRLGDWRGVRRDLGIVRDLLGEHREDPPHFVSSAFAVAALVHEYRGEHVAADAVLDVLSSAYRRKREGDRDALPLGEWAEFVAPLLARRGRFKEARRLLAGTTYRRRGRLGLLFEARLEVAAEGEEWDLAASLADEARAIAAEGGLQSLPIAADMLEGRAAHATGEFGEALDLLSRAVAGFDTLEARWDAARARLALAVVLVDAGFPDRAVAELRPAVPVLEDLGARRELDAAREIIAAAP
jgi:tetratricopeptide (TPR) repeat protein